MSIVSPTSAQEATMAKTRSPSWFSLTSPRQRGRSAVPDGPAEEAAGAQWLPHASHSGAGVLC